jgi:hypothetical protein
MPNPRKPFVVEADASKYASGVVLQQQDTNGDWHPCAYILKSFNETERNYDITCGFTSFKVREKVGLESKHLKL